LRKDLAGSKSELENAQAAHCVVSRFLQEHCLSNRAYVSPTARLTAPLIMMADLSFYFTIPPRTVSIVRSYSRHNDTDSWYIDDDDILPLIKVNSNGSWIGKDLRTWRIDAVQKVSSLPHHNAVQIALPNLIVVSRGGDRLLPYFLKVRSEEIRCEHG
jgi:hypothetical protein